MLLWFNVPIYRTSIGYGQLIVMNGALLRHIAGGSSPASSNDNAEAA